MSNYNKINNSEGDYKKLQEELRFKIGEQYELNEFKLKWIESTFRNGLEYENYEYTKGDFKTLLGIEFSSNIILQYNGDILSGIIYSMSLKDLGSFIERLNNYLPFSKKLITEKLVLGKTINVFNFQEISLTLDIERVVVLGVFKI